MQDTNFILQIILVVSILLSILLLYLYINLLKRVKSLIEKAVKKAKKNLKKRLYYDDLTLLRNNKALDRDIKHKDSVVLILLDIDAFEDINELYGFMNANIILKEVANALKTFEQNYNVIAYRLSGDIFCLANTTNMPFEDISILLDKLTQTFTNKKIYVESLKTEVIISMSMGISLFQDEPLPSAATALRKAKALNQSHFVFNNELRSKELIVQSLYWREKIKEAIEQDKIIPFYQPIVNKNKEIIKYETLMRIKDQKEGESPIYITPDKFLGISFKTKQYLELSRTIVSKSLDNLHKTDKQITINLSFKDILNYDFLDFLDEKLLELDIEEQHRLVFEILESENLSNYNFLEEFINKYKQQGIKIAIDDFGSGYSNFIRVIRLKPDYIKIDGSLIKNIDKDTNSYEIVKSIVAFSKPLGIKVIAEFVHSKEIFDLLNDLNIDEFQGYFLGKPKAIFN